MRNMDTAKSIELVYGAITRPELWSEVVESITHESGSNSGLLCVERSDQRAILTYSDYGLTPRGMEDYADYYVGKDIWLARVFELPVNEFHLSHDMTRQKDFLNSEIYNDWGMFEHIQHATGVIVESYDESDAVLRFCLQRSNREGEYTPEEKAALDSIVPHMRRAIAIHSDLVGLNLVNERASRILDQLPFAAFLVDDKCRIQYRNGGTDSVLAEACGFSGEGGVLSIDSHRGKFERQVHEAISAGQGANAPAAQVLTVHTKEGKPRYEVSVSPLIVDDFQLCLQYQRVLALVIVRDVARASQIPPAVQLSYGLTPVEVQVAEFLCNGLGPSQIASEMARSFHTVRTHIRNILGKTETRSQVELVAKLLSAIAPISFN